PAARRATRWAPAPACATERRTRGGSGVGSLAVQLHVRQRLLLIVAVSVAPAVLAAAVRWRDSRHELQSSMEKRLKRAERSFAAEVDKDTSCAMLAVRAGAREPEIAEAIIRQRPGETREAVLRLGSVYTDTVITLADASGNVLAASDPTRVPATLALPEL